MTRSPYIGSTSSTNTFASVDLMSILVFTAGIRRTREGNVFSLYVCSHRGPNTMIHWDNPIPWCIVGRGPCAVPHPMMNLADPVQSCIVGEACTVVDPQQDRLHITLSLYLTCIMANPKQCYNMSRTHLMTRSGALPIGRHSFSVFMSGFLPCSPFWSYHTQLIMGQECIECVTMIKICAL